MDKLEKKQLTEARVDVMFREIMVGQELINKDQLDDMQDRQQEKLRELQRDVVNLGNMKDKKSDDKNPVPQTA